MRTELQKQRIVETYSRPIVLENVLSTDDIAHLIEVFIMSEKVVKNTGPITVNLSSEIVTDPVIRKAIRLVREHIGDCDISAGLFFKVDYPHIIHNDDTWSYPQTYKGITIPLELYGDGNGYPGLCIFDQYYLGGPSKFFKGESEMKLNYNKGVYEYSEVSDLKAIPIPDEIYNRYLTHVKRKWLEGLSINTVLQWKPGDILIFDSTKLHCATDFRKLGYSGKLGLSIFTKINGDVADVK